MNDDDVEEKVDEIVDVKNYYLEWCKQRFTNSGIGTGQLSLDQEIAVFDDYLFNLITPSLDSNVKLANKIKADREKIINLFKKRASVDKDLSEVMQKIVDYYMKLE